MESSIEAVSGKSGQPESLECTEMVESPQNPGSEHVPLPDNLPPTMQAVGVIGCLTFMSSLCISQGYSEQRKLSAITVHEILSEERPRGDGKNIQLSAVIAYKDGIKILSKFFSENFAQYYQVVGEEILLKEVVTIEQLKDDILPRALDVVEKNETYLRLFYSVFMALLNDLVAMAEHTIGVPLFPDGYRMFIFRPYSGECSFLDTGCIDNVALDHLNKCAFLRNPSLEIVFNFVDVKYSNLLFDFILHGAVDKLELVDSTFIFVQE